MAVTEKSVSDSMDKLVAAINKLTELVRTASEEMHQEPKESEPNKALEDKLDTMIGQNEELIKHNEEKLDALIQQNSDLVKHNEEIRSSLLLLLELSRQHLPSITKNNPKPAPSLPTPDPLFEKNQPDDLNMPILGLPPELPRE